MHMLSLPLLCQFIFTSSERHKHDLYKSVIQKHLSLVCLLVPFEGAAHGVTHALRRNTATPNQLPNHSSSNNVFGLTVFSPTHVSILTVYKLLLIPFPIILDVLQLFSSIYNPIQRLLSGKLPLLSQAVPSHRVFPFDSYCSDYRYCNHTEILFSQPLIPFLSVQI